MGDQKHQSIYSTVVFSAIIIAKVAPPEQYTTSEPATAHTPRSYGPDSARVIVSDTVAENLAGSPDGGFSFSVYRPPGCRTQTTSRLAASTRSSGQDHPGDDMPR